MVPLGELASDEGSAIAIGPFGSRMKTDNYVDSGVKVVRGLNITDAGGLAGEYVYVTEAFAAMLGTARLKADDIVLPHRGAIGRSALVPPGEYVMSTSLMRIRLDRSRAWPEYVTAFLCSDEGKREILQFASTVGTPGIGQPLASLRQMRVPLPPIEEQRQIAAVLGALDDLIATNRQLQDDLVQLRMATMARAASRAVDTTTLGEIAELVRTQVSPANVELRTRYLGLEHLAENAGGLLGVGVTDGLDSAKSQFQPGDVLYGKLRPYFRKVVRPNFGGVCSTEIWVLRPKGGTSSEYLEWIASTAEFTNFAMAGSGGTRMPRANWDHVQTFVVAAERREYFAPTVQASRAMREQYWALYEENDLLARVRDELLPLLLSGRLQVNASESLAV